MFPRRDDESGIAVECAAAHDPDMPGRVLRDEIAIDFPAVDAVVERIREAFVAGEAAESLRADLHLTVREATRGTVVPIDVPVRSTCAECGGRGGTWTERCARCDGRGHWLRRHQVRVTVPAGVADGSRFRLSVAARHESPTHVELHVAVG